MAEFNAERFLDGLTAQELSELKAVLNSEEYERIIEDWEESFDMLSEDY